MAEIPCELNWPSKVYHYCKIGGCYSFSAIPAPELEAPRLLIFAMGRTRSTLLESLLNSTGYFEGRGEVFNPKRNIRPKYPTVFLEGYSSYVHRRYRRMFLCHIKLWHLTRGPSRQTPRELLQYCERTGWKIVYLYRENTLLQALSVQVRMESGVVHRHIGDGSTPPVRINVERLLTSYKIRRKWLLEEVEALEGIAHRCLTYERDLKDATRHQATADSILRDLGLASRPVQTTLIRSYPNPRDIILNYDEVEQALAKENLLDLLNEYS